VPASPKLSGLAAAVALTAALTSCSTGGGSSSSSSVSSSSSPASASTLKQQAQHEHGLVIYANIPSQYFQPLIAAFNKQYPLIKVSVADLSDNVVFSKYEAEAAQGARTADLLIASAPGSWVQAEQNGVSAGVTPTGLSAFPS
jgi:iron(III) transport system substrate-binding protein